MKRCGWDRCFGRNYVALLIECCRLSASDSEGAGIGVVLQRRRPLPSTRTSAASAEAVVTLGNDGSISAQSGNDWSNYQLNR
ncbi:hypothetical protein PSP6_280126 [Paraburkholderia tropica]|nr:hypothetical protein PSP6_280126 [Paraburkholderia tropica]